jgi:hypothetical protein
MADDGYLTIFSTTDLAEGELVAELLQGEGIAARFRYVSAALIGAGPQIFETRVDVPAESEARTRELLADLAYVGAADDAEAEPEEDDQIDGEDEPEPEIIPKRRPLLAGVAFLIPGGGHFYARRPLTGLVLLAAVVYCWVTTQLSAAIARNELKAEIGFGMFVTLFVCDFVGGVRACRAANRGDGRPAPSQQIFRGLVLVVVSLAAGGAFAAAAAIPGVLLQRKLARFIVKPSPTELTVLNGDRDGRTLSIAAVRLRVGNETWGRLYNIEAEGHATLDVPAGGRGTMPIAIPEELRGSCARATSGGLARTYDPYPDDLCTISFSVAAAAPADPASLIEADGSCLLVENDGREGLACTMVSRQASSAPRGE